MQDRDQTTLPIEKRRRSSSRVDTTMRDLPSDVMNTVVSFLPTLVRMEVTPNDSVAFASQIWDIERNTSVDVGVLVIRRGFNNTDTIVPVTARSELGRFVNRLTRIRELEIYPGVDDENLWDVVLPIISRLRRLSAPYASFRGCGDETMGRIAEALTKAEAVGQLRRIRIRVTHPRIAEAVAAMRGLDEIALQITHSIGEARLVLSAPTVRLQIVGSSNGNEGTAIPSDAIDWDALETSKLVLHYHDGSFLPRHQLSSQGFESRSLQLVFGHRSSTDVNLNGIYKLIRGFRTVLVKVSLLAGNAGFLEAALAIHKTLDSFTKVNYDGHRITLDFHCISQRNSNIHANGIAAVLNVAFQSLRHTILECNWWDVVIRIHGIDPLIAVIQQDPSHQFLAELMNGPSPKLRFVETDR